MNCLFKYLGLKLSVEKLNISTVYMTLLFGIKDSLMEGFFS